MSTQIAIRLSDDEIETLDTEVTSGRAANRSDALRRAISVITRAQRYRREESTLVELAQRGELVYPDLEGLYGLPHPPLD